MNNSTIVPAKAAGFDEDALERVKRKLNEEIDAQLYDGAVILVARGGQIVCHQAFGQTDLAQRRAARTDDIFLLMSLTKSFTAAAVLQLIDQGRLSLHTKVAEVIPEFGTKGKQRVTIFHLLTHTAGTWRHFCPVPPMGWTEDVGDIAKCVRAVSNQPLAHMPGERVVYNPWADYTVLAEVVRRLDARKRQYRDILAQDWFQPLGMIDTSLGLRLNAPRRVPVRIREAGTGVAEKDVFENYNNLIDEKLERPAGGVFSTAIDMFQFAEMLRKGGTHAGHRFLSPALLKYSLRNHTGTMPNEFWDYGKEMHGVQEFPANFMLVGGYTRGTGHHLAPFGVLASPDTFGAIGGGSTMFMVDPERELSFVFLSAGFLEGLNHFRRLERISDLVLASID